MIDFISSKQDFLNERNKLELVFQDGVDIVQNSFASSFKIFVGFEFDKIYSEEFFNGLIGFLCRINNKGFSFYTLDPSTDKYFFRAFSKYSICNIPISTKYSDYIEFMHRDPGGSPADALLHNAETIALYSEDPKWGITGSNDLEIGIIGFKEANTKDVFLSFFEQDYFTDIENRVQEIKEVAKLGPESFEIYAQLVKNYLMRG